MIDRARQTATTSMTTLHGNSLPSRAFICAGPHCNGADKAAVRLARLGRRVKKMIGGIEGWKDEGFDLATQ